ncbi:MAG: gamma-glutamylcyclotransferase, partial [Proteobacteria bacterium]|nr:gamma-glutamylcyclotransferase [Pseudomonadota bacterium]
MILSREAIRDGVVREIVREAEALGLTSRISDEERNETLRAAIDGIRPGECVWLFGYGSLMWNPAFHYCERRPGTVHGFHRSFCMWTAAGRGSPELAGVTLG